jgi:hypothetical protein
MDTKAWGPSGWQLSHYIAEHSGAGAEAWFDTFPAVLPCKYCRASTAVFFGELPFNRADPAAWLYEFHRRVNAKLRAQGLKPARAPPLRAVRAHYRAMAVPSNRVLGGDFLAAVAYNWDKTPPTKRTPDRVAAMRTFWDELARLYPGCGLDTRDAPVGGHDLLAWLHGRFVEACGGACENLASLRAWCAAFKSKCSARTHRGKTCRRKTRRNPRLYEEVKARLIE